MKSKWKDDLIQKMPGALAPGIAILTIEKMLLIVFRLQLFVQDLRPL